VVAAGLLHDVAEDTATTLDELREKVGEEVAGLVAANTERKVDEEGRARAWAGRKREALNCLSESPVGARAVGLADKLHNLLSIELDLTAGFDVWATFRAERGAVLDYYREAAGRWGGGDARVDGLARGCLEALERIEEMGGAD